MWEFVDLLRMSDEYMQGNNEINGLLTLLETDY